MAITDENGNFKEKRHFDAWGNIVKLEDGNGNALSSFKILDRGYAGHEHLLGVGIIHMNGRLYDPILHRFLSPDNFVQDPFNTQNYNRYGYVLNNPLKFFDPSGEISFKGFLSFVYKLAAVVVGAALFATVIGGTIAVAFLVAEVSIGLGLLAGASTAAVLGYAALNIADFLDRNIGGAINSIPDPDNSYSTNIQTENTFSLFPQKEKPHNLIFFKKKNSMKVFSLRGDSYNLQWLETSASTLKTNDL